MFARLTHRIARPTTAACRCATLRSQRPPLAPPAVRLLSTSEDPPATGCRDFNIDWDRELRLEAIERVVQQEALLAETTEADQARRERGITSSILSINRVQKTTKGGSIMSYKALVVAGNMRGAGGYGVAKGQNVQMALQKALLDARRNFIFVERHAEKTLYHDVVGQRGSTKVIMRSAPPGKGIRASHIIRSVCVAFGIEDCVAKCYGQRNPYSVVQATFDALQSQESAEYIALKRGRRLITY